MQVCISLQTDNHSSTTPLKVFLQAGCASCRPANSVKALNAPYSVSNLTEKLCIQVGTEPCVACLCATQTPKVKSPPAGRGRGAASRRGAATGRGRARKRIIQHSDDNASEEDKYIPRSSKRRAAVAAVSRMKQPSDYEDDDFDDVLPARPLPTPKPLVTKTGRPRGRPPRTAGRGRMPASDDDDSDGGQNNVDDHDSSEDSPPKKKKRASHKAKPTCHYGKECYRSDCFSVLQNVN